jgi:hypothetical protein
LECISDTDKLLTKAQAWMEPERFAEYRAAILNSHPCYSICSAAGKEGLKAAASLALKWLPNAVGGPFR